MKAKLLLILTFSILCFAAASVVRADDDDVCVIQGNMVSLTQIVKNAQDQGYTIINKFFEKNVKLNDDCIYKVKAKDNSGQRWELFFDPSTGKLISKKPEHD